MQWEKPHDEKSYEYFEIKYRNTKKEPKFNIKNIRHTVENEITLCNLEGNTEYEVKGFIIRDGESNKIFDKVFRTKQSSIPDLIKLSVEVWTTPMIYKLPCFIHELDKGNLRDCHIISDYKQPKFRDASSNEKNVLIVGATGSGKSTLIDAMINHIVDVSFGDGCRFKMIDLTDDEKRNEGKEMLSQTTTTTCYRIPRRDGFSIDFSLNIIDTPGFNDTGGKSFDKKIPIQIRKLFESVIHCLHAVCIVVPLSSARLTEAESWVFNNILSLFGSNIKNIIYPCITFDDGGDTKCLAALEAAGIPYVEYFRFNNSDLFVKAPVETIWNNRRQSFENFFSTIGHNDPQCLKNSEKVLKTRAYVTIQLENIQEKIRIQVNLVNTIKNEGRLLKRFESEIESNKDFNYEESVPKKVRTKSKKASVNCKVCEESCHKKCNVPFDLLVRFCEAFARGECTICKNKCKTDDHKREEFEYETVFENIKRTKEDLEKKYKVAKEGQEMHKSMMENEKMKLRTSIQELKDTLTNVEALISSLNKIALKTEHFSIEKYLDELIDLEQTKQEAEFPARIDFISKIKNTLKSNGRLDELIQELSIETL